MEIPEVTPEDEEINHLLLFLVEFAQRTLRENGAFHPFGAGRTPDGEITIAAQQEFDDALEPEAILAMIHNSLVAQAIAGEITAAGICTDVVVSPPGWGKKTDAICVELQHIKGAAIDIFQPYTIEDSGQVHFSVSFSADGEQTIFLPVAG